MGGGDGLAQKALRIEDIAHDRIVPVAGAPNATAVFHLLQVLEREQAVQVLLGVRGINVHVIQTHIGGGSGLRQDAIGRVTPPGVVALAFLIEGPVGLEGNTGRAKQRDGAFRERRGEGRPRNGTGFLQANPVLTRGVESPKLRLQAEPLKNRVRFGDSAPSEFGRQTIPVPQFG
jgi:hypothetical protein